MSAVLRLQAPEAVGADGLDALEDGRLLLFPDLPFRTEPSERDLFDPAILGETVKNVSYDPATDRIGGAGDDPGRLHRLRRMLVRYAEFAHDVVIRAAPAYAPRLERRRTSFRPGAVGTRALSPRKDDRRLHVDAFPANPTQGRRILRVFTNADPSGADRVWNIGEPFESFAAAFAPRLRPAFPGSGLAYRLLRLTKGRRTAYDHAMLGLHDHAKLDDAYQATAPRETVQLPAGATWMVFTDCALHAALAGRYAFEKTFLLPVDAMATPSYSPIRVLERLKGKALV